jgi:hypothetical protein
VPVDISDDDEGEEEDVEVEAAGPKRRKLTSAVWKQFKRMKIGGKWKAKCIHCSKKLGGETKNGTKHLHDHLRSCVYVKIKNKGKTLGQSSLRFNSQDQGKISVENYTFDQEFARKELANMIVLHEYPLCIVDHAGFRRFVTALQPLFKMVTRNTIRYAVWHICVIGMLYITYSDMIIQFLIFNSNLAGRTSLIITEKKERKQWSTWLPIDLEWPSQLICGHLIIKRRATWLSQPTLLMIIGSLGVLL